MAFENFRGLSLITKALKRKSIFKFWMANCVKPPLVLALNRITQPLALPRARAALASFPPFPHEEEELRVHGPSGVNAPNKGEVATTVAFSSDRPKKVSRASDSRPLNPGLFCSTVSLFPLSFLPVGSALCPPPNIAHAH